MTRIEMAKQFRKALQMFCETLTDEKAVTVLSVFPEWKANENVNIGDKRQYNDRLYKCRQAHVTQEEHTPDLTPAMWEEINVTNSGTIDDPIPYNNNMELVEGLYYTQNDITYLCTRSTGTAVYNDLSALVGIYVEEVTG